MESTLPTRVTVSEEDYRFLCNLIENPPPPNEGLRKLMSYRQDDQQPPKDTTPPQGPDGKYPKEKPCKSP